MMTGVIYVHSRDLRLTDNPELQAALNMATQAGGWFLPVALWDPGDDELVPELGLRRLGLHYRRYWIESVEELQRQYEERGGRLLCARATPDELVAQLREQFCGSDSLEIRTGRPSTLISPDMLTTLSDKVPHTFSSFRRKVEAVGLPDPQPHDAPARIPSPPDWIERLKTHIGAGRPVDVCGADDPSPHRWDRTPEDVYEEQGGETAAHARLQDFVWQTGALRTYKETRNGLLGTHYSSRLSAALAHGTLSAAQVLYEVRRNETALGESESTYWLVFELLWREFFAFHLQIYGSRFFSYDGYGPHARPLDARGLATGKPDSEQLQAWIHGTTPDDFVNAAMRELSATGYMSNRARQNAASYLIYDLRQPWWVGAAYFQHALTDYDPASNWGNWAYIAGVGADSRGGRHFNTKKQAQTYDPQGEYISAWT